MKTTISFLVWLLSIGLIHATTINVPSVQPTIQAGINTATDGDTVLVSPGIYRENINFNGKNIVVGSLSLTTGDTSYISQTIIDGNGLNTVVLFINGEDSTSMINGFSIVNGLGKAAINGWPYDYFGGGITCRDNSNPRLRHLVISENSAPFGAGICIRESNPLLENVCIYKNTADHTGGGIYCYYGSNPILRNVTISKNTATFWGGGISCLIDSKLEFINVLITENKARDGGGIWCFDNTRLYLENVTITNNCAFSTGGGLRVDNCSLLFNSSKRSNIYLNYAGIGSDICGAAATTSSTISVIVDTFTVINPTNYHTYPLNNFTFNIQHAKVQPIDRDLYVSPNGNDLNSGISPAAPLRTVSFAISKISTDSLNPHTIYISEGTYSTSSGEHFPLNVRDYVSLSGASEEDAILDAEGQGRVIFCYSVQGIKIENLSLTGGSANAGGAINCTNSSPVLKNLKVYRNTATNYGGGVYCEQSSPTLNKITIYENSASRGGGIFCINNSCPILENVTMSRNTAYSGSAVYSESESNPHLVNTILWNNFLHEIRLLRGDITVEYSDIKGGKGEIVNDTTNWLNEGTIHWLEGNIDANPLFCNPVNGNYTLAENSPCLGAGKNGGDMGTSGIGCDSIFIIDEPSSVAYVSANGSDTMGIGSYDNPFATIQYAINFINSGDTILVYPGTYHENITLNKKGIVLGSFFMTTGDTSYISQTVINGDSSGHVVSILIGDSTTVLSGFTITNGYADQGGGIVCTNSNAILSNLIIIGNTAEAGGGMSSSGSKCRLINSVVANNKSNLFGGGIFVDGSNPLLSNVIIKDNIAEGSGGGCSFYSTVPYLTNVTITGNRAYYNGGGISLNFSSVVFDSVKRCNIYMNYAGRGSEIDFFNFDEGNADITVFADTFTVKNPTDYHAYRIDKFDILHGKLNQSSKDLFVSPIGNNDNSGETLSEPLRSISTALSKIKADSLNPRTIYLAEGKYSPSETGEHFPLNMANYISLKGEDSISVILDAEGVSGVLSFDTDEYNVVENLVITGGFRFEGGGIYCASSSPNFVKVIISGNKAMSRGGGMNCSDYSNPNLENCTITNNEADLGGGIALLRSCVNLLNTILWNNSPDEIYFNPTDARNCVEIAYTNVMDSTNRIITNNNGDIYWLEGNLNSNPLFCNAKYNDYFLAENSPCVGSGTNGKNIGALPVGCGIVGTENIRNNVPTKFGLFQNYPNPFNPVTKIKYELPIESDVKIVIYNLLGEKVAGLVYSFQMPGKYEVEWNAENFSGGIYFYSIKAGNFSQTKKMVLLR